MFIKLKKIRMLIKQNLQDLQKVTSDEQRILIQQTHQHLKQLQIDTLKKDDTVYLGKLFGSDE